MIEKKAYTQAAGTGQYDKSTGLLGKYDNVRRFWEDQVTGFLLRPPLIDMVKRKRKQLQRIRILDLGCGSGDGFDLLMDINIKNPGIYEYSTSAITPDMLKEYVGLDINEDLLKQAEEYYGQNPKTRFVKEDLSNGLPEAIKKEEPFDIYLTSYGTLSHFHDDQCVKLITDICEHASDKAIFIGDWLGRYAYEWQDLWRHPLDQEYFMDYRISYIYPEEARASVDVASFPLRLMTQDEVMKIIEQARENIKGEIKPVNFLDRSILVGRHMDTGDYNKHCHQNRFKINSLFENYLRTDLESLLIDYMPLQGYQHINDFFEKFFGCCNALIEFLIVLLSEYDQEKHELRSTPEILLNYPQPLKEVMHTMKRIIEGVGWLDWGDVRANVIEPHLGYSLRKLEMDLAPGTGFGHSLMGIFEIIK